MHANAKWKGFSLSPLSANDLILFGHISASRQKLKHTTSFQQQHRMGECCAVVYCISYSIEKHRNRTQKKIQENSPKIVLIYFECDLDALSLSLSMSVSILHFQQQAYWAHHTIVSIRLFAIRRCAAVATFKLLFSLLVRLISHSNV